VCPWSFLSQYHPIRRRREHVLEILWQIHNFSDIGEVLDGKKPYIGSSGPRRTGVQWM
jgi:hypothetical protein